LAHSKIFPGGARPRPLVWRRAVVGAPLAGLPIGYPLQNGGLGRWSKGVVIIAENGRLNAAMKFACPPGGEPFRFRETNDFYRNHLGSKSWKQLV
jgi:hypothetical protein